jgi:iron complex outermembrane receptor protein
MFRYFRNILAFIKSETSEQFTMTLPNVFISVTNNSRVKRAALRGVCLAALLPAAAVAQTAPPPPPLVNPGSIQSFPAPPPTKIVGLQDVLITARHRAERAQSVPVSLTVIDQRQIQALGSLNLNKIKQLVPTLTINAYNPRNIGLDIRGLGSVGFFGYDGLEGGVGIYVDGVLLGRSTESNFDLPDLQDIEVLRGPQGTLFGKNTVAGAVAITTKLPSFKPEADFSASLGDYNYWQFLGYATGALGDSDKAAVSLTVHGTQNDGFIKNTYNGARYGNQDDKGVRGQVLLEPNSRLTVRIIANYDHSDANCCITTPVGVVSNFANGQPYAPSATAKFDSVLGPTGRFAAAGYTLPTIDPFGRTTDIESWNHYAMETAGLSVLADYDLSGYTLSSITAGSYYDWYPHLDGDGTGAPILTAANNTTHQRQFSQEFRVTSPLGGTVDFTSGLYFFYQQLNDQAIAAYGSAAAADFLGKSTGATYDVTQAALNGFASAATDIPETYSGAAYGQATWHLNPQWDLTGGARFTYEDKTGDYYEVQEGGVALSTLPAAERSAVAATRAGYAPIEAYQLQHSNILPGGLVTLSYKPAANILTYATYSHGEKSAGLNFVNAAATPKVVAPEKVDNFELGAKTTLLDDRLLLDGDAFWDEDADFQSTIFGPTGPKGTLTAFLSSVPKVRSRGLELDSHAQITANLTTFLSGVFDEAYYESDPSGPCPVELSNQYKTCDLTGRPLAGASKWSISFGGEYDQPLPEFDGKETEAYVSANGQFRTSFFSTGDDSAYSRVPGYGIGNIEFGIRQVNDRWDLSGFVHNFTNEHYYLFREVTGSLPTYNLVVGEVGDPLTFGVTLRAKFQ